MVDRMCAAGKPGKVEARFRWLIDQLEARLPVAGAGFSSRPPELVLLEALDALLKEVDRLKFNLLLPTKTQLAASQLREQKLLEVLGRCRRGLDVVYALQSKWHFVGKDQKETSRLWHELREAEAIFATGVQCLSTPQDTADLQTLITKAGEVMRERCFAIGHSASIDDSIRAIPAVTMDDLKGGAA